MKKICKGEITSGFGTRIHPVTGVKKYHNGVDIGCPVGTEVFTPVACVVAQTYYHKTGGWTIILRDTANDDRYGFCHLSEILVKVGQILGKGDLIALSGDTGVGTGAHLHFSYAVGGVWANNVCTGFFYRNPVPKINYE